MTVVGGMRLVVRGLCPAWCLAALIALPACPRAAHAAAAGEVRLLAHGSGELYWIARVCEDSERGGGFLTDVYVRPAGDALWHQVARVEGRAVDLAQRGDQLALLLDGGAWLLVSDETVATGRAPPWGARILAVAPRGDTLLALARVYEPSSAPATTAPAAVSTPSTQPAREQPAREDEHLVLLSLAAGGWVDAGSLDIHGPLPATSADVSLAVVEGSPLVAVRDGPGTVTVYRQGATSTEMSRGLETRNPVAAFKLLGGGPVPVLWTVDSAGAARLHWLNRQGVKSLDIDLSAEGGGGTAPAAATYAIERIRVVTGRGLVLSELSFDALNAAPSGGATRIQLPRTPVVPPMFKYVEPLLTVLLLFTIVSSLRRRREMQESMQAAHELPLAPFGRRLIAGAIDAAPLAASAALVYWWERQAEQSGGPWLPARSQVALLAGVLTYLLHTTTSEIVFGRTIGKAICGLRVVGLDGGPASPAAMFTRNVLRLIDLSMVLFPLVLVLYSPLRQRAGDVAAGTLVVQDRVGPEVAGEDADEASVAARETAPEPVEVGK